MGNSYVIYAYKIKKKPTRTYTDTSHEIIKHCVKNWHRYIIFKYNFQNIHKNKKTKKQNKQQTNKQKTKTKTKNKQKINKKKQTKATNKQKK